MPSAFFIEWPGAGEILLILVVVLVLFGPKRLPEIARTIGGMLNTLRRASQDFHDHVMQIEESPPAIDAIEKEPPRSQNAGERNDNNAAASEPQRPSE